MKKLIIVISFLTFVLYSKAQNYLGPKLTALGNNGAAVKDLWSIESNIANITDTKQPTLAIGYAKYIYATDLSQQSIIFIYPLNHNAFGISFQRYGIPEYQEIKAGLAFAKDFGKHLSIGIKANYHQLKILNYGLTNTFSVDVGVNYNLNENINAGLFIKNPSRQSYPENINTIASIIGVGASYKAFSKVLIAFTVAKEIDRKISVSTGLDYNIFSVLNIRGGISTAPFKQYGGFGLNIKNLTFDAAVTNDINIGLTPQIALAYAF